MNVIGIKGSGPGTAAALATAERLYAVAEERLNGTRYSDDFPTRSVRHLLSCAGVGGIGAVDLVVASDVARGKGEPIEEKVRARLGYEGKVLFLGNHDAHAAAAYFASPFDDAAVLVVDHAGNLCRHLAETNVGSGGGSGHPYRQAGEPHYLLAGDGMYELQCTYRGWRNELVKIGVTPSDRSHPQGIIGIYQSAASFLNLGPHGLGSVADLAAWEGRKPLGFGPFLGGFGADFVSIAAAPHNGPADPEAFGRAYLGGLRPRMDQPLPDDIYTEVARVVQTETEKAVITMARRLAGITRARNICVGGAIVFNGTAMRLLAERGGFDGMYTFPTGDGVSVAAGCALWGAKVVRGSGTHYEIKGAGLGPDYSDEQVRAGLEGRPDLKVTLPADLAKEAAGRIAEGRTVAWFQGGSEAAPRGAGRRSILAAACEERAGERMRAALGRGERFRPYGVSILEEFYRTCFELGRPSPWMGMAARVREPWRQNVRSALRGDGSAMVHTVSRRIEPLFYDMLEHYWRLSGVPLVLNAPLRSADMPMAERPADAVSCFLNVGVDCLAAGPYLVEATGRETGGAAGPRPIERHKGVTERIREVLGFR